MPEAAVIAPTAADVSAVDALVRASRRRRLAPQPRLSPSEWVERHRYLSSETSAEPGLFSFQRTPYLRAIVDAMGDLRYRAVVVKKPSQVGYTEALNSFLAYCMVQDPSGILMVQPTVDLVKQWNKERLKPMVRDTPTLAGLLGESSGRRESEDTLQYLKFPGGYLAMQGANSPAGLASRPLRRAVCDEVNRWLRNVGGEGSGIALIEARLRTFWNSVLVAGSSPGDVGESLITELYDTTDQRLYLVPCHDCRDPFRLLWRDDDGGYLLRCDKDDDGNWLYDTAFYACPHCGSPHTERHKPALLAGGDWVAERPEIIDRAGFWVDGLMSPWVPWPSVLRQWDTAKAGDETRRTFINTVIGEDYAPPRDELAAQGLMARTEPIAPWPAWVGCYTVGVDLQGDRWEWLPVGWGAEQSGAVLAPRRHYGRIDDTALTREVADAIAAGLGGLRPEQVCVDTGFRPEVAWSLVDELRKRGIRAVGVKGDKGERGRPMVTPPAGVSKKGVRSPWMVATDTTEEAMDARLRAEPDPEKPGRWLALSDELTPEDCEQLAAAMKVRKTVNGRTVSVWTTPPGRRNEVRDCARYALAGLYSRGARFIAGLAGRSIGGEPVVAPATTTEGQGMVTGQGMAGAVLPQRAPAAPRRFRGLRL